MEIRLRDGLLRYDDEDHDLVLQHTWYSAVSADKRRVYAMTRPRGGKTIYLHRLLVPGAQDVDHRNGDGLDNRRINLRAATRSQNMANSGSRGGSSQYKGVFWWKAQGRWSARITVDGKQKHLGLFEDEREAALAYDRAAVAAWGEFARINIAA